MQSKLRICLPMKWLGMITVCAVIAASLGSPSTSKEEEAYHNGINPAPRHGPTRAATRFATILS